MKIKKRLCHGEAKTLTCSQRGFTLVELMVSLLIGLVIVLGATQLFMVSRESFEQVENLGLKQGALNFSVDVLSRDIRRATSVELGGEDGDDEHRLCIKIADTDAPDEQIEYYLEQTSPNDKNSADYSLKKKSKCDVDDSGGEISVLVSGFAEDGLTVTKFGSPDGLLELTLSLLEEDDNAAEVTFQVMNRMRALSPENDETLPADCYTPSGNIKGRCK